MREAALDPAPCAFRDALTAHEQAAANTLIATLERDPSVDRITKFDFPRLPLMLRLRDNAKWRVVYHVPAGATVVIRAIS